MEPACSRTDDLGYGGGERNHVMAHFLLDLVDTFEVEVGTFSQNAGSLFRHETCFGKCFCSCQFDFQPVAESVVFTPNAAHFRAGITWNQDSASVQK